MGVEVCSAAILPLQSSQVSGCGNDDGQSLVRFLRRGGRSGKTRFRFRRELKYEQQEWYEKLYQGRDTWYNLPLPYSMLSIFALPYAIRPQIAGQNVTRPFHGGTMATEHTALKDAAWVHHDQPEARNL
eukprot:2497501-Rhodomonas_salina.1